MGEKVTGVNEAFIQKRFCYIANIKQNIIWFTD